MLSVGLTQFNEMTIPRIVEGETSHKLIAQETASAQTLSEALQCAAEQEMQELLLALDTLDFQHAPKDSILLSPKLPYIALAALHQGLLNPIHGPSQVATLLIFWAAVQRHGAKSLETVPVSMSNLRVHPLIQETLDSSRDHSMNPFLLERNKYNTFINTLCLLPLSEQRFLLAPRDPDASERTVSDRIHEIGINVFNKVSIYDRATRRFLRYRMIPSCGMMQTFLNAQFENHAVALKPRTYLSTLRHIRENRLISTCDMMLPTPDGQGGSHCPTTADTYPAPWYEFTYHDFFHAIVSSNVETPFRIAGIDASDHLRQLAKEVISEQDRKNLNHIAVALIDMEYTPFYYFYRQDSTSSLPSLFWQTLNRKIVFHRTIAASTTKDNSSLSKGAEIAAFGKMYHSLTTAQPQLFKAEHLREAVDNLRRVAHLQNMDPNDWLNLQPLFCFANSIPSSK